MSEEFVHFAFDPDNPGFTTPIFDVKGNRIGDPIEISKLPRHGDDR